MRIVHISDIHAVLPQPGIRHLLDKRLLGTLNHQFRRRRRHDWARVERAVTRIRLLKPDLVLLTGDISTTSNPAEFALAVEALKPLVQDTGLEFIFVPGNHDSYVNDPVSQAALREAFQTLNRGRWQLEDLPVAHEVGPLRLFLVNQAVPAPPWGSWGALSPAAAERLKGLIGDKSARGKFKQVLVSHFPMFDRHGMPLSWRRSCHGNEVLVDAFEKGDLDMAFCGHIHHPFVRWEAHGSVEFCAGSLTNTGLFNLLEFDPRDQRIAHEWIDVDLKLCGTPSLVSESESRALQSN